MTEEPRENGRKIVDLRRPAPDRPESIEPQRQGTGRHRRLGRILLPAGILAYLAVGLFLLLAPLAGISYRHLREGDISPARIRASKTILVPDDEATARRVTEAVSRTREVWDLDADAGAAVDRTFTLLLEQMDRMIAGDGKIGDREASTLISWWHDNLGPSPEARWFVRVGIRPDREKIFQAIVRALDDVFAAGVVEDGAMLAASREKGLTLRRSGREEGAGDVSRFLDVPAARERVDRALRHDATISDRGAASLAREAGALLVSANMVPNRPASEAARRAAAAAVAPVGYRISRGEVIVREGEMIGREAMAKLSALATAGGTGAAHVGWVLLSLLLASAMLVLFRLELSPAVNSAKRMAMIATLLLGHVAVLKGAIALIRGYAGIGGGLHATGYLWAIPAAAFPLLAAIFFDRGAGMLTVVMTTVLTGFAADPPFPLAVYHFLCGSAGVLALPRRRTRSAVLKACLWIAVTGAFFTVAYLLTEGQPPDAETAFHAGMALVGGMIVGAVTSVLIPLFEIAFKETTDIRLLELLDMTQTPMRRLVQEAPGTYHHAIMVGNLAVAAAEAVRSNALLARVGAYYHDIGKLAKPDYFVENLGGRENIHDRLAPTMSALVIISHIREGVDIAERAKVPREIIDIIREHHGTGLLNYFYQKAKDAAADGRTPVKEDDFRYPGPKPRSKEAAIVMLADQIEAAVKAIRTPEPAKVKAVIQKIINDNFADGQLSECRLTLEDLQRIAIAFFRNLEGTAHLRPDYPQTEKLTADHPAKRRKNGRRGLRPVPPKED